MTDTAKEITVRTPEDEGSIPMQAMDIADEDQILTEFKGLSSEMLGKWIYEFETWSGGEKKKIQSLSWVGTKEASIWLSGKQKKGIKRICLSECPEFTKWEDVLIEGKKYVQFSVVFEDLVSKRKMSGTVTQPYFGTKADKSTYSIDPAFVLRIAESKAQRNAMQKLIPASSLVLFIDYALKQNKVQKLVSDKAQMQLTADEAKNIADELSKIESLETLEECREYYKALDKMVGKLTGKELHELKRVVSVKGQYIKDQEAKKKVKDLNGKK